LNGTSIIGEAIQDAVVINTFGEAVPIPSWYADRYPRDNYAEYCYVLGQKVNQHNWTWVSIVGYPLYYVSNTAEFVGSHNSWGIYGMIRVAQAGINAFLQGIDNPYSDSYSYDSSGITGSPGIVHLTSEALELVNYYGIYPAPYQTSTRALSSSILTYYNLDVRPSDYVFELVDGWIAGATFSHKAGEETHGALTAIGLTRTPDIRITALALLQYYRPALYRSEFGALGTTRLVVLQLSQQGEA
jgi:hypothetical protein